MEKVKQRGLSILFQVGGFVLALLFVTLILVIIDTNPLEVFQLIWEGATGSMTRITNIFVVWAPLVLVTCGLLVTFTAGLWNIGIEGQITLGAIFATGIIRMFLDTSVPPALVILISILGGMVGGAIWAALPGILKAYGGVNEIFGGLGLNFIATALNIGLIFGAWSRPGVASMSGTEPFPQVYALPTLQSFNLSWYSIILAIISLIVIFFLLQGTHLGLPRKYARSAQVMARINPTATWDCFNVMLLKATIAATKAPTNIPVKKPNKMLSVVKAAQNPIMPDKIIKPLSDRFVTPARSDRVSPIAAIKMGAPASIIPAKPKRIISPDIKSPISFPKHAV